MSRTVRLLSVLMMAALLMTMVSIPSPTGGVAAQARATVTINPFQDTYVDQATPTSSNGGSAELWVMADEFLQERRSLLQFLLADIPAEATITNAELQLYLGYSYGSSSVTLTVERNTEAWAGGTATWNNRPATDGSNWGDTSVGTTPNQYYAWDVTALVQGWYAGTLANYGLTVKGPQEYYGRRFDSREGTAQPKLVVEYNVSEPPPDPQGVISGRVWHDDDQDGVRDFGEADLQGVRLDLALGGVVVDTLTTDASGLYSFTGLEAGAYSLTVDDWTLPGAYQLATGSDPRLITLISDDATVGGVNFGYDLPETDLVASSLEVTQAVQDLDNSVRLAAGKRTFVRFHVRSRNGVQPTMASLLAETDGRQAYLLPLNTGMTIDVQPDPQRAVLDHAFLFELPSGFREGTVSLTATLNPILLPFRATHSPLEQTYDNNTASTSISFENVPDLNLILYRVGYEVRDTGTNYIAGWSHVNQAVDWLRRAYPVADVWLTVRDLDWGTTDVNDEGRLSDIGCGSVHTRVDGLTSANMPILFDGGVYRSYGLVDDGGGFMRGCSPRPGRSASGPTGSGTFGWDFDGSYGDWYTGHELGHSLAQAHIRGGPPAGGCGDEGGGRNLYNPFGQYRGTISPIIVGDEALVGYDFGPGDIYPPLSHDVMTYCDYQWMSDITYEGLMDRLQSETAARAVGASATSLAADGWLRVSGTIDPDTNDVDLDPIFVFPTVDDAPPTTPGDYAIVLRSGSGTELARHPFTPVESDPGPSAPGDSGDDASWWAISEFVPAVAGVDRVDIEGPGGALLATVSAGATAPAVSITAPAGGTVIPGAQVTVSWSA
ncbi:MAG: DNRLRE domain-containing protein, partial [Anaerolineae bacterium]